MSDLSNLRIWREPDLKGLMPWYRAVADNLRPAKFRIAAHVPVAVALDAPEEDLWAELDARTPQFLDLWNSVRGASRGLPAGPKPAVNLVDISRELAYRMLTHCNFCRYDCRVDRISGLRAQAAVSKTASGSKLNSGANPEPLSGRDEAASRDDAAASPVPILEGGLAKGFSRTTARENPAKLGTCKLAHESRVSTYFHHLGEEQVYRGTMGSGTIFFTSCNMRCAFCQNGDISTDRDNGRVVSPRTLATMAWLLRVEGCHNINWVGGDPTIHLHTIIHAISLLENLKPTDADLVAALPGKADYHFGFRINPRLAHTDGAFNAPMLWNSNFFMSAEAMRLLRLLMDVWLPDFKFGPGRCAPLLSKTPFYWETVTENLKLIHDWGEDFTIRHLVMPEHVECCTLPVLKWVAENMPEAPVNIMDQYHPDTFCDPGSAKFNPKYRDLTRRITREELKRAFRYGKDLGIRFESLSYEKNRTSLCL